jgi:hypothetical protein
MKLRQPMTVLTIALVAAIVLLAPVAASAQSCALCYTQAASSGSRIIQALRSGILILIAPPTFGSVGLIIICYRKRNQTREAQGCEADREWGEENSSADWSAKDS